MDLSKLIKDIAANAKDEAAPADAEAEAAPQRRQVVAKDEPAPAPAAPGLQFASLAELAVLDDAAAAKVLDAIQPDDVVITIAANPDEDLRRWLLAPLDQESRHWVVDNAMQLGEPTANLAREAGERIVAVANRLAADGRITEDDRGEGHPPARATTDPDHLTPPKGNPVVEPKDEPHHLHLSPTVGFAVGGNPATAATPIADPVPEPEEAATGGAEAPAATGSTGAPAATTGDELSDLRRQLAHLIAMAQRHGQETVAALADEAPHPLLQAGLQLLAQPISRNDLDQVLLDAQAQLERAYAAQCDLVRNAVTAIYDGTKPEDFLAAN